jgi:hypothetical protein
MWCFTRETEPGCLVQSGAPVMVVTVVEAAVVRLRHRGYCRDKITTWQMPLIELAVSPWRSILPFECVFLSSCFDLSPKI